MSDLYNTTSTFDAEVFAAPGQIHTPSGFQRFKDFITRQLTNVGLLARPIGISALNTTKEVIEMVLNLVGPVFVGSTSWILDLVKRIIYSIADQLWIAAQNNLDRYRGVVCSTVACIFASLAVCLPKTNISNVGRFLVIGMSILVYFSKSYLAVGIGFGLVYIMSKFAPGIGIGIDINNYIATPQGFKEDTTKTILDLVSISVLLTAATSGLTFPTDAKSWDDMLKRHSLLHRSFKAWEFGVDKIVEVFETVSRYILKYFFGKEFVSFEHIGEVEQLYDEVIELTRLDINVDIGRDIALANRIEKMYAVYLNLLRVYCKNRDVVAKLQKIGAPLTEFYRRVADKNPKAHVMRKEPVCMAIYGPTGIGKSYLMSRMQQDLLKIAGKFDPDSPTDGLVYSRAIEQEFWDGYTGQPIAIFDDFGQKVDAPQNPNNEFFEIIRAVNIFPYQLHSAALQEKANNPFTSDFVVLTTNLMNFKPTSIVSAEAFTRRIHINCSITLKPEVRVPGTEEQRLDLGRLKEYQEQNNLEFYDLSHLTFTPLGEEPMTYEQFIVKVSLLYKKHLDAFEKRQKSNILTAHNPLPTGAFSVNPTWAQPQAIEDEPTRVPRIVLPRRFVYRPQEFNSHFRTNIWSHFSNASDYVRRFILTCWEDMEWFRNYTFDCFMPYYYSFRRYLVITAMSTACITVFTNVLWSGEKEFQRAPIITTLVRGILSFHGIAFTSRNAIYFYPTLAGTLIGLTRTVVRDILKHSIYHQVFDIHCHVCNKHKRLINNIKPAPESADPIELLCELGSDQEEGVSFESANKVPAKERINLEAVKMPKKRKDESVEEFQERYLVQAKSWLEDFKEACNTIVIDKLSKEDTEKLLYTRGFMTKTDRKRYEENHKVSAESSMKVQAQKSVQFEGTSVNHDLEEDVTFESSMKHPVSKQCVNIESETKQILMKEAQAKLDKVTALCESREKDDTTKKRASYEGIRCQQLESLKTMAQRNTWLLSSYIYGFKNDVGFVTVLKGHKALMNFHYFQILAKHFKDIPEEEHRLLFSYPTQEGGHEIMFKELARTAVPLMRGLIQTEFYIVTLPSTCNLGRDLTKHLIEPAKVTNLDRGLPLHLCTFRKDANGNWRSTTIAGPLEKITTSDVADLLEEGKTHRYLESVYYLAPTKGGDCGNPIFIDDDAFGKKLLGFHFAGLPGKGICAIVTAKDLEDNLKSEMCLSDPVNIDLGMDDEDFPMKDSSFISRV